MFFCCCWGGVFGFGKGRLKRVIQIVQKNHPLLAYEFIKLMRFSLNHAKFKYFSFCCLENAKTLLLGEIKSWMSLKGFLGWKSSPNRNYKKKGGQNYSSLMCLCERSFDLLDSINLASLENNKKKEIVTTEIPLKEKTKKDLKNFFLLLLVPLNEN